MLKRAALLLSLALIFSTSSEAAEIKDCASRPAWCVAGYSCEPTPCAARAAVALDSCSSQLVATRQARPRWFRPFVEGGGQWDPIHSKPGFYAGAGVMVWRIQAATEITQDGIGLKLGFRREW